MAEELGALCDRIRELTIDAEAGEIVEAPKQELPGTYFIRAKEGLVKHFVEPATRVELARPQDLVNYGLEVMAERKGDPTFSPLVTYNAFSICFYPEWPDGRHLAEVVLRMTPQWQWLCAKPSFLPQQSFVRLLRTTLAGCVPGPDILTMVRKLKQSTQSTSEGEIQHGKESLGKNIMSKVSGEGAIPEQVTLVVPLFENFPQRFPVVCDLEIDPGSMTFQLTPLPQELTKASDAALEALRELLDAPGMPATHRAWKS